MKIIKNVSYEEVKKIFKASHPFKISPGFNTNAWALNTAINGANQEYGDLWTYVELEPNEIIKIFLPWHEFDCGNNNPLIPQNTKMNVIETAFKIQKDVAYAKKSPKCFQKINYWMKQDQIAPVFLSTQPVKSLPEHDAYRNLSGQLNNLFHLDGFHRLISWSLKRSSSPVYAYVVGVK